jgi:hypothetical protein
MLNSIDPGVRLIQDATKPGDVILDLSANPMFYVLTGRFGPGYADLVMPGTFRDEAEETRFLERLEAAPPDFVLVPTWPFDGVEERGYAHSAPKIAAWVEENYVEIQRNWAYVGLVPRANTMRARN